MSVGLSTVSWVSSSPLVNFLESRSISPTLSTTHIPLSVLNKRRCRCYSSSPKRLSMRVAWDNSIWVRWYWCKQPTRVVFTIWCFNIQWKWFHDYSLISKKRRSSVICALQPIANAITEIKQAFLLFPISFVYDVLRLFSNRYPFCLRQLRFSAVMQLISLSSLLIKIPLRWLFIAIPWLTVGFSVVRWSHLILWLTRARLLRATTMVWNPKGR